jgi:hypothetical protein
MANDKYRVVVTPEWVKTKADWHIWKSEYEIGIPSEEHYKLLIEEDKWATLKKEARERGDEGLAMKYHLKAIESGNKLAKFIEPYIKNIIKRKRFYNN